MSGLFSDDEGGGSVGPAQGEGVGGVLATRIGDLDLECCVYNASGPRTGSHQALRRVAPAPPPL